MLHGLQVSSLFRRFSRRLQFGSDGETRRELILFDVSLDFLVSFKTPSNLHTFLQIRLPSDYQLIDALSIN
jgi:hypothetical protein